MFQLMHTSNKIAIRSSYRLTIAISDNIVIVKLPASCIIRTHVIEDDDSYLSIVSIRH